MKHLMRRLTALALTISMVISVVGIIPVFAADEDEYSSYWQIKGSTVEDKEADKGAGDYEYHAVDSTTSDTVTSATTSYTGTAAVGNENDNDSNAYLTTSKTVEGTENENEFEVTLQVVTSDDLNTIYSYEDAAVVLVMDSSISMQYNVAGTEIGWPNNTETARMDMARTAAINFLDSFVKNAGTSERLVSLVTFDREATTLSGWVDATDESGTLNTTITSKINTLDTSKDGSAYQGGTNMDDGLQKAQTMINELIADSSNKYDGTYVAQKNIYVVLLSDGAPTYYMSNGTATSSSKENIGTIDTKNATETSATAVKSLATLYTVAFAEGSAAACYTQTYSTANNASNPTITVSNWLSGTISSQTSGVQTHYDAASGESLTQNFEAIAESIARMASAWTVTDPMGSFIKNTGVTSSNATANNGKSYTVDADGTIIWNLKTDDSVVEKDDTYTYTLTYKIALNTDADDFVPDTYYLTNGATTLTYCFVDAGDTVTDSDLKTTYFTVPAVKGQYPLYEYNVYHYQQVTGDDIDNNAVKFNDKYYVLEDSELNIDGSRKNDTVEVGINDYSGEDYHYSTIHSTAGTATVANGEVSLKLTNNGGNLNIYYNRDTTTATVYHHYATTTVDDNGSTTEQTSIVTDRQVDLYVGDDFTGTATTSANNGGYSLIGSNVVNGTHQSDGKLTDTKTLELSEQNDSGTMNIINFYYDYVIDNQTYVNVTVEHHYTAYTWEMVEGVWTEVAGEAQHLVSEDDYAKQPLNSTYTVTENDVEWDGYTITDESKTNLGALVLSDENGYTIVLNYESYETDPRVDATVTVEHIYEVETITIDPDTGKKVTSEPAVEYTDIVNEGGYYVGESFEATLKPTNENNDEYYKGQNTKKVSLEIEELTNGTNKITIHYLREDDQTVATDVTVYHVYTQYVGYIDEVQVEVGTDEETGEAIYETEYVYDYNIVTGTDLGLDWDSGTISVNALGEQLYAGQTYTATASSLHSSYTANKESQDLVLDEDDNTITFYYTDYVDLDESAGLTVSHFYKTVTKSYVNGSMVVVDAGEYVENEEVYAEYDLEDGYYVGESITIDSIPEWDGDEYTMDTNEDDLFVILTEDAQNVNVYYVRYVEDITTTDVVVNHTFVTYHSYVDTDGTLVIDEEIVNEEIKGDEITEYTVTVDGEEVTYSYYEGMSYYATEDATLYSDDNGDFTADESNVTSIANLAAEGKNEINLTYTRYTTSLVPVTVMVTHSYTTHTTTVTDGVADTVTTTDENAKVKYALTGYYEGMYYTAKTYENGFTLNNGVDEYTEVLLVANDEADYDLIIDLDYEKSTTKNTSLTDVTIKQVYVTHYNSGAEDTIEYADPITVESYVGVDYPITLATKDLFEVYKYESYQTVTENADGEPTAITLESDTTGYNVITIYYERDDEDRTPVDVTVYHHYSQLDTYTNVESDHGTTSNTVTVWEEDLEYTADLAEYYATTELDYEYVSGTYRLDVEEQEDAELTEELTITLGDGDFIINLYYVREVNTKPSGGGGGNQGTIIYPDDEPEEEPKDESKDDEPTVEIPDEDVPLAETPDTDPDTTTEPEEVVTIPVEDVPLAQEPTVEIPVEEIPLAEVPIIEIPVEEVPLGDAPDTGDNRNLPFMFGTAILSAAGLAYLLKKELDEKKKKQEG